MSLESATYVEDLVTTNPPQSDLATQGAGHLRLIKTVLKSHVLLTRTLATDGAINSSDNGATILVDTSSGNVTCTIASLAAGDAGWHCTFVKSTTDSAIMFIAPPSGTIAGPAGSVAKLSRSVPWRSVTVFWDGTSFGYLRPSGMPGDKYTFPNTSLPTGFGALDGSAISRTNFPELFAVYGTTYGIGDGSTTFNLPNYGGYVVAGIEGSATNLTSSYFGGDSTTVGETGGKEKHVLLTSQMATHYHPVYINDPGHNHEYTRTNILGSEGGSGGNADDNSQTTAATTTETTGITIRDAAGGGGNTNRTATIGSDTAHNNTQPTIIARFAVELE